MKFAVKMVSKQSGRLGSLIKADVELTTPLVMHYTKVNISSMNSDIHEHKHINVF